MIGAEMKLKLNAQALSKITAELNWQTKGEGDISVYQDDGRVIWAQVEGHPAVRIGQITDRNVSALV